MHIAILVWGSLVWRPTANGVTLNLRSPGQWDQDGPSLPIEFARISRDGALTLVVVPGYPHSVRTLWSLSGESTLEGAIKNLASREGIMGHHDAIHGVLQNGSGLGSVPNEIAHTVHEWLVDRRSLNAAIWTGLGTQPRRWQERGYSYGFTPDNAMNYLRSLQHESGHPAFEYMRRAPEQIQTPVRRQANDERII